MTTAAEGAKPQTASELSKKLQEGPGGVKNKADADALAQAQVEAEVPELKVASSNVFEPIAEEVLAKMIGPEIRAVAHDRGYDIGEGGTRVSRIRFIEAQGADPRFKGSNPDKTMKVGA